ncbi:Fc.00g099940.m01.CDS01 [Cosmosporella sp. VM-42]
MAGEDDSPESMVRAVSTISPGTSNSYNATTCITSLDESTGCLDLTDIAMLDSNPSPLSQITPSSQQSALSLHANAETTTQSQHLQEADTTTLLNNTQLITQTDCYVAILTEMTKLEQTMTHVKLAPPIDFVLKAEQDFHRLLHNLLTCTGHELSPLAPNDFIRRTPCLNSDRPVLVGLALLAERVIGILEELFRLAAESAHNTDKANQVLWCEGATGSSARRLQRSFRNSFTSPCVTPVVEANRVLRIQDFVVQDHAKSEALRRILRLRVNRMLKGIRSLDHARRARLPGQQEKIGGALDWGGSKSVLADMADSLVDDLIRRLESMQSAMVIL